MFASAGAAEYELALRGYLRAFEVTTACSMCTAYTNCMYTAYTTALHLHCIYLRTFEMARCPLLTRTTFYIPLHILLHPPSHSR